MKPVYRLEFCSLERSRLERSFFVGCSRSLGDCAIRQECRCLTEELFAGYNELP